MILVYHLLIIFLQETPYDSSKTHKKSAINFKWAQVLLCGSPLNAYTIVRAKCPPEWGLFERVRFFYCIFLFYFILFPHRHLLKRIFHALDIPQQVD